MFLTRYN
jgi:uncharacterized protein